MAMILTVIGRWLMKDDAGGEFQLCERKKRVCVLTRQEDMAEVRVLSTWNIDQALNFKLQGEVVSLICHNDPFLHLS